MSKDSVSEIPALCNVATERKNTTREALFGIFRLLSPDSLIQFTSHTWDGPPGSSEGLFADIVET